MPQWNSLKIPPVDTYPQYPWAEYSTYITRPPFFDTIVNKNSFSQLIINLFLYRRNKILYRILYVLIMHVYFFIWVIMFQLIIYHQLVRYLEHVQLLNI
jgi:hypothetical protein